MGNNEAVETAVTTAVTAPDEVGRVDEATVVAESINQQIIRVPLTHLIPFSGTLYDENGNPAPVSGNPFYVPEDYLPVSAPTTTDETSTSDMGTAEEAEVAEKKPDKDTLAMRSLHASIEQDGILTPLLVRPAAEDGFYEILSGYRRKRVCEVLSETNPAFNTVPVLVVEPCDDDTASSIITSANVQRKEISFLETIKSCGQMYRALRHRGTRNKKDEGQTADVVSQILGLKPRTVQRYSQLLELPERMLVLVGTKAKNSDGVIRLPIRAGEVLSSLSKEKLALIEEVVTDGKNENVIITESTAKTIRKNCTLNREITRKEIERILKEQQKPAKKQKGKKRSGKKLGGLLLDENRLRKFCGNKMTEKEVAELIYGLVEKWSEGHKAE